MADSAKVCPHCGGNIETELNCSICRLLFGLGKTFHSEDWMRRTPGPATKAMLDVIELYRVYRTVSIDELWDVSEAFLAEWKPQVPE